MIGERTDHGKRFQKGCRLILTWIGTSVRWEHDPPREFLSFVFWGGIGCWRVEVEIPNLERAEEEDGGDER